MITPGSYVFTYQVSIFGSTAPSLSKSFDFTLTLSDPCVTVALTTPTFVNKAYTISDDTKTLTFSSDFLGVYSVDDPLFSSYCSTSLVMSTDQLLDDRLLFNNSTQTLTLT